MLFQWFHVTLLSHGTYSCAAENLPASLMKTIPSLLASASLLFAFAARAETPRPDPFEEGMRQAFMDYKKGDNEAVTAKLRELLKLMEERDAQKVGGLHPAVLNGWKGERLQRDDLGIVGGGLSISRVYVSGKRDITVKVMKDSPLVKQLLPLLTNEDLIRMSNRKTHNIAGETAIMEGEKKMRLVLDGRILVELVAGGDAGERELVAAVRKLDLKALAKMQ